MLSEIISLKLSDIKEVVSKPNYKEITADDYNNAIIAIDAKDLNDDTKENVKKNISSFDISKYLSPNIFIIVLLFF